MPAQVMSAKTFFYMYLEYESPFMMGDGNFEKNENILSRNRAGIKLKGVAP